MDSKPLTVATNLKFLMTVIIFLISLSVSRCVAYKNYTVGDTLGWFDKLEKPNVNYDKWALAKTFSLGDFLIFNTDNNHSVVQTYNSTVFKQCDYDDSSNNDTIQWSSADPSAASIQPQSVAVPLVKVGPTYFFSSDFDGEQCKNGQKLTVNVTFGQGLPPSLKNPSKEAPSPADSAGDNTGDNDDDSAPDTVVPSNFNNPKNVSDNDDGDGSPSSASLPALSKLFGIQFNGIFIVVIGLYCIFL